jgi:hypothetical protein
MKPLPDLGFSLPDLGFSLVELGAVRTRSRLARAPALPGSSPAWVKKRVRIWL